MSACTTPGIPGLVVFLIRGKGWDSRASRFVTSSTQLPLLYVLHPVKKAYFFLQIIINPFGNTLKKGPDLPGERHWSPVSALQHGITWQFWTIPSTPPCTMILKKDLSSDSDFLELTFLPSLSLKTGPKVIEYCLVFRMPSLLCLSLHSCSHRASRSHTGESLGPPQFFSGCAYSLVHAPASVLPDPQEYIRTFLFLKFLCID